MKFWDGWIELQIYALHQHGMPHRQIRNSEHPIRQDQFNAVALALHRRPQRMNSLKNFQRGNRRSLRFHPLPARYRPSIQRCDSLCIITERDRDCLLFPIYEVS